ncbi:MAG: DEAD/DEAH box helicase [Candidatus Omnitrophica bacterium]|nr:DEAD/DEAH box helicase [Candidatus Omnitrophota bacterium]MDD5436983.1 DEAD/DEAH box helicase [Candidatus Omnitrophota bacterium]
MFFYGRFVYNVSMIYDRFQNEAIEHIKAGHSVIVSAPTGAGKTAIAEHVLESCIEAKEGVIYTAPIKALSNQKFRDFAGRYGDNIGILTGDVSLNVDAPVLIMTTEIFRNKVLDAPDSLKKYSWIIFDEVHYIDNPERGTVWEESLIFLPPHMNILCLSATIPNIKQFAAWIESIHKKPVKVVIEDTRPVPLHFFFQCHDRIVDNLNSLKGARSYKQNRTHSLIKYCESKDGLPVIYFVFGRKRAEYLASELYGCHFLDKTESAEILALYENLCRRFDLAHEKSALDMIPLIERGVGFHHAGMLPTLKEVIERLFTSRLLKVIFTTETFALGINMPSRSVIFDELMKFYGSYTRALKTRDFYQMAGRAGRRGIDTEGFVYSRINLRRIRLEEVRRVIYGQPENVNSQFNASYATMLNLYERYKDELFNIYPLSLHYFQTKAREQRQALRVMEEKLKLLKELGHISEGKLTPKGQFAKAVYGYELLLAELYDDGVFENLDEMGLAILAVATVFEPRKGQVVVGLSKNSQYMKSVSTGIHESIVRKEAKHGIRPYCKAPHFNLAKAMEGWMHGMKFERILDLTDTDEGEVIRYFRMAIQILREINDAPISPILAGRIRTAIRMINRDIIDAEKQLREG